MPHIEVKCYPGRTEEQKKRCAEKIAEVVADTLGCSITSVSVAIKEIPAAEWKEKVWDVSIVPAKDCLYIKPGYSCE